LFSYIEMWYYLAMLSFVKLYLMMLKVTSEWNMNEYNDNYMENHNTN